MLVTLKYFLKSTSFKIIFGILLIISGIVLYSASNLNNNIFSDALNYATEPLEKALWYVSGSARDFSYQFEEKEKLKEENELLRKQVNDLRDTTVDYYDLKKENARFKKYYGIKESNKSLRFVSASVIGRNPTEVFGDFVIDKGTNSGVSVNDAVITENGMVGKICEVSAVSARVKTIFSPDSQVGVLNLRTGDSGIISGGVDQAANNLTKMIFIPAQSDMQPGDMVVTGGASGMYPKNLKVGTLKSIEYDSYEAFYYALIEPFENIKEIRDVFVITDFNGKGVINLLDTKEVSK